MLEAWLAVSLLWIDDVGTPGVRSQTNRALSAFSTQTFGRPARRDEPLREANITDSEVRQIEGVVREMHPGSLVYISAVIGDCPCEDGPGCRAQVWSTAQKGGQMIELSLSRIDGEWQIGPLQAWWLRRAKFLSEWRGARETNGDMADRAKRRTPAREHLDKLASHNEAYPRCSDTA
ncbi:MAG: hypothetical protein AAGA33_10460 [Pseudomonadota bacterium]